MTQSHPLSHKIETNITFYATHPDEIDRRLGELDREWDLERALSAAGSGTALFGLIWGMLFKRRYLLLPLTMEIFALQHARTGWCLPTDLFRRMGFRTQREIDEERYALKALRGDFKDLPDPQHVCEPGQVDRLYQAVK